MIASDFMQRKSDPGAIVVEPENVKIEKVEKFTDANELYKHIYVFIAEYREFDSHGTPKTTWSTQVVRADDDDVAAKRLADFNGQR